MTKQTSGSKQNKDKKPIKPKHPGGRPSIKTPELLVKIFERLANGESLRSVCSDKDMPDPSTIEDWRKNDKEFSIQYVRAKAQGIDKGVESIIELVEQPIEYLREDPRAANAETQRRKLIADTKKWYYAKLAPKLYGDRVQIDTEPEESFVRTQDLRELSYEQLKEFVDKA